MCPIDYLKTVCDTWTNDEGKKVWNYLMYSRDIFSICENKTVLEIGPFSGWHTALITSYNPKHLTVVEPNIESQKVLCDQFPHASVIVDDIYYFLEKYFNADVVVCCGVLYHLHSPIYLLEQIVNKVNPKYIILETFDEIQDSEAKLIDSISCTLIKEELNIPGNRYTAKNKN